jgi:hypothetical protein
MIATLASSRLYPRMICSRRKASHIGALVGLILGSVASGSEPVGRDIEIDKVLARIEINEGRVQSLEWTVECHEGKVTDPAKPETATFGPVTHRGHVVIERFSGRYRVDLDSVMRWFQGAADHVAERNSWSFDGVEFRDLNYTKPGKELPQVPPKPGDDPGRGRIYRAGEVYSKFEAFRLTCGIGSMPPNYLGKSLSKLIRSGLKTKRSIRIREDGHRWLIMVPEPDGDSTIALGYDPNNGAILGATWENGNPERPWLRQFYELQEVDGGFWVPKKISTINLFNKTIWQTEFSNVRVNAAAHPAAFTLTFPPGISVTDPVRMP